MHRFLSVSPVLFLLIFFQGCDWWNPKANKEALQTGRYVIHSVEYPEKRTIILDTAEGKTWMLGKDNNSFLYWVELERMPFVSADFIYERDPKTGKLDWKPSGKKYRINSHGNIKELRPHESSERSEDVVPPRLPGETIAEYLKRTKK